MTSFGRGRGWSSLQSKEILRRPGGLAGVFCTNEVARSIIEKLDTCDVRGEDISPQLVQEIVDLVTNPANRDSLKDTCDMLWKRSVFNDSLTAKIAAIFSDNKIALLEDCNKDNVRARFLRFLQDNYMSREKNRVEDKKTFANIVLLHSEVYYRMRLSNSNKLKILAEPLIHYLGDLLQDSPKENLYFILIQILRSGKDLYMACPQQLQELMLTIRQILVKENDHSSENRAALLLMVELADNNYEIKDTQLKQFYVSHIASISFEYPFCQEKLKVVTETMTENDNQLKNMWEVENNQRIIKDGIKNDTYEQSHHSKSSNVPRAIRGSGALDIKKEDNINTNLNSLKIAPSKQKSNKGSFWDHDDRFHKDYE